MKPASPRMGLEEGLAAISFKNGGQRKKLVASTTLVGLPRVC